MLFEPEPQVGRCLQVARFHLPQFGDTACFVHNTRPRISGNRYAAPLARDLAEIIWVCRLARSALRQRNRDAPVKLIPFRKIGSTAGGPSHGCSARYFSMRRVCASQPLLFEANA